MIIILITKTVKAEKNEPMIMDPLIHNGFYYLSRESKPIIRKNRSTISVGGSCVSSRGKSGSSLIFIAKNGAQTLLTRPIPYQVMVPKQLCWRLNRQGAE